MAFSFGSETLDVLAMFTLLVLVNCVVHFSNVASLPGPILPFPPCKASNLECIRRGFRTFLFLMDEEYIGMSPVDPTVVKSLTLIYPDIGLKFTVRNANISGARWTELVDRRINYPSNKTNTATFSNKFHITGRLIVHLPLRPEPYTTLIVIDCDDVKSNITYPWEIRSNILGEHFIGIGDETIAVATPTRTSFYLERNQDEALLRNALENRPSIIENLVSEVTGNVLANIVNNFRFFGKSIPLTQYYKI